MTSVPIARVFVLTIADKAVLAFEARNTAEARELCSEAWMLDDLKSLTSEGRPIWNGQDKIAVRPASADEASFFREADGTGDAEEILLVYLIALDDA